MGHGAKLPDTIPEDDILRTYFNSDASYGETLYNLSVRITQYAHHEGTTHIPDFKYTEDFWREVTNQPGKGGATGGLRYSNLKIV